MKETIRSNAARFSARRMVKEYVKRYYLEAIGERRTALAGR
jgi:glucan phosphorylase